MAMTVKAGWLEGHAIRCARKVYRCEYYRSRANGGYCRKPINPGDFYVEGEGDPYKTGRNGIMLQDRYCMECASPWLAGADD